MSMLSPKQTAGIPQSAAQSSPPMPLPLLPLAVGAPQVLTECFHITLSCCQVQLLGSVGMHAAEAMDGAYICRHLLASNA